MIKNSLCFPNASSIKNTNIQLLYKAKIMPKSTASKAVILK
jgi:hypothetical protein